MRLKQQQQQKHWTQPQQQLEWCRNNDIHIAHALVDSGQNAKDFFP